MRFLLESFDLEHHLLDDPEALPSDLTELAIDYNMVNDKCRVLKEFSVKFLQESLTLKQSDLELE